MKNIFDLHKDILSDYKLYIDSFINIAGKDILTKVNQEFKTEKLFPQPLIQFNPSFKSGGKVNDLVEKGILVNEFNDIFYDNNGESWSIHKHQTEAITKGNEGRGFIVTSGTGSGKSLTYISTIFNFLFKHSSEKGIKAIIVYPLNALINSQESALKSFSDNFKKRTGKDLPFTFSKYTGQEKQEDRERLKHTPPDILLTNYMMLELLMVRKDDVDIRESFLKNLRFLVFDELHVYKGRQGADVSLLIRRIKSLAENKNIICIGTSATMASGSIMEQKKAVATVAGSFFDTQFTSEDIIVESVTYSTKDTSIDDDDLKASLSTDFSKLNKNELLDSPLTIWLERSIALVQDGNEPVRNKPKSLKETACLLTNATGANLADCEKKIIEVLVRAEELNIESAMANKKDTVLPFKMHQFISQTGYVYVTLQKPGERYVTLEPNPTAILPETGEEVPVYQTVFSRISGIEFICVRKNYDHPGGPKLDFRDFDENLNPKNEEDLKLNNGIKFTKLKRAPEHYKDGYLVLDSNKLINIYDFEEILPPAWLTKTGKVDSIKALLLPSEIYVTKTGAFSEKPGEGEKAWFIPAPLIYDLTCGVLYQEGKLSEKSKLISLGNEGRSTSTTLITLQTLLALHRQGKPIKEQKIMSFTDNRQDASLQSGHFNDFMQVVQLRSAIEKVLRNTSTPLGIYDLIYKVEEALNLKEEDYATNPSSNPIIPNEKNKKALRNYIAYRIILDLKRGWRYILPNLEQTALLEIDFENLDTYCSNDKLWQNIEILDTWNSQKRKDFILQILNYFRNLYAIDFEMLRYENRMQVQDELNEFLNKEKLWSLDKGEKLDAPNFLSLLGNDKGSREVFIQSIGQVSRLGRFVKSEFRKAGKGQPNGEEYASFMSSILDLLRDMHYLKKQNIKGEKGEKTAYQLILTTVQWDGGDKKTVAHDKTSFIALDENVEIKPHLYFQKLYTEDYSKLDKAYIAAEHTGQISNEQKVEREDKFNLAKELSALYCSPTMELGIDISSLNIVHMRNVPPSPSNYAQRSGRAGRSGQSALVFTYASKVSPHDKHYFADPVKMVSGVVQVPRIDLTNEELIKSHINATVLSVLKAEEFKPSLIDLIDSDNKTYRLKPELKAKYQDIIDNNFDHIYQLIKGVIHGLKLQETTWYSDEKIKLEIKNFPAKLEDALLRWRKMYLDALRQMNEAHEIKTSPIIKDIETKKNANRSYWLAENRLKLLLNRPDQGNGNGSSLSEFYTFRYLASEGFLPGYNFTRKPIRVFLGGKDKNESISRARFTALREFGPNNLIYHNGGKYKITRITPNDVALDLSTLKISKDTHYAFLNEQGVGRNQDPITGKVFDASNMNMYTHLLELEEAQSENTERISCMEEIRSSEGYEIELYLNTLDALQDASKIKLTVDGEELMKLFYAPSANLIMVNKKWRRANEEGYKIGTKSGQFKTEKQTETSTEPIETVKLYTYDTSDILYIQPVKALNLNEEGVITLQFALEQAVEQYYNIEPVEIAARLMGAGENKNIMLYEASEGSIGVLKDIARNTYKLKEIFKQAYQICGYNWETKQDQFPDRIKASYDDLLSYYNQRDHDKINRHSVIKALELLILSNPDSTVGSSYEQKYEDLKKGLHHRSPGEKALLDYLFLNGYRLPDYTNYNLEKYFIQPDFIYKDDKALIFVDGGIHKNAILKADDAKKRFILEKDGYDVLVWDETSEPLSSFVTRRQDIFRKVR